MPRLYYIHRNNLKQFMLQHGIKLAELEEKSGLSITTIKEVRQHRQEPTKFTTEVLSMSLGVEESTLFPRTEIIGRSRPHSGRRYIKKADRMIAV